MQQPSFDKIGTPPVTPDSVPVRTKKCRYCGEEILIAAQKCKHCGEFLSPNARRAAGVQPMGRAARAVIKIPMGEAFVALFLFLPLGIVALIFASQAQAKLRVGDFTGAEA